MTYIIKSRGDISENWASINPVLAEREIGLEMDTKRFKVGDGVSSWLALDYWITTEVIGGGGSSTTDAKHRGPWQAYPTEHIDFESGVLDERLVPDAAGWTIVDSATLAADSAYGKALDSRYPGSPGDADITLTVETVSGNIDFYREIWSDSFDKMQFYIDGTLVYTEGGTSIVGPARPWTRKSFPVTAGTHTFKWRQHFDSTGFNGYNGWRMTDINWPSAPGENGYLVGDVVTYQGYEWRCNVLNTGSVPGADLAWTKVSSLIDVDWTQVLDDPTPLLAEVFTNGTAWTDNTNLQLVTTGSTWKTARYEGYAFPNEIGAYRIMECEFEVQADFNSSTDLVRIALRAASASSAAEDGFAFGISGTGLVDIYEGVFNYSSQKTPLTVGWHKLRMVMYGGTAYGYIDGVLQCSMQYANYEPTAAEDLKVQMWGYGLFTTRFRNLKAWHGVSTVLMTLPT